MRLWRLLVRLPRGVHFALLGSLLFALRALLAGGLAVPARQPIQIGVPRIAELKEQFRGAFGREPGDLDLRALLQQEVDDLVLEREARLLRLDYGDRSIEQRLVLKMRAITSDLSLSEEELYRQALELGLDDDLVIRRQLREKMRLLLQQDNTLKPYTDAELQEALKRHRQRFEQTASYTFTQVFVSADLHGARLKERAQEVRAAILANALPPQEAQKLADPFPLDADFGGRSQVQIAKIFASSFAQQVAQLGLQVWSQPLASPFGLHLVFLQEKTAAGLPPLESVKSQLLPLLEEERAARRLQAGLEQLRELYEVDIAW